MSRFLEIMSRRGRYFSQPENVFRNRKMFFGARQMFFLVCVFRSKSSDSANPNIPNVSQCIPMLGSWKIAKSEAKNCYPASRRKDFGFFKKHFEQSIAPWKQLKFGQILGFGQSQHSQCIPMYPNVGILENGQIWRKKIAIRPAGKKISEF